MAAGLLVLAACAGSPDDVDDIEIDGGQHVGEPVETRRTADERRVHEYLAERRVEPEHVDCGGNGSPAATERSCSAVAGETLYRLEVGDDGVVRCFRGDLLPGADDEFELAPTCG